MLEYTVYGNNQGCGYIANNSDDINDEVRATSITINGKLILPGEKTTLDGYFTRPLEYLGIKGKNELIFLIGVLNKDIFEVKYYYQAVFKIEESRIFEMFSRSAGRDHYFIKGKWK